MFTQLKMDQSVLNSNPTNDTSCNMYAKRTYFSNATSERGRRAFRVQYFVTNKFILNIVVFIILEWICSLHANMSSSDQNS